MCVILTFLKTEIYKILSIFFGAGIRVQEVRVTSRSLFRECVKKVKLPTDILQRNYMFSKGETRHNILIIEFH